MIPGTCLEQDQEVSVLLALKMALMRRGVRQYDAARLLGITDTRTSRIICGRLEVTDEEKKRLARLLQTLIAELFADAAPELRRLAAAVRDLKEGELDALYVRRLLQWLFEIQQALAARSQVRAGGDEQHALARERASNAAAGSTHRAFDGDEPGRVKNAIEVPLG